ncbi:hypothetical protein [Nocardioides lianchengensis]|uniref:Uncharacterized protein n=1 Tax=Nocardioides lianchengensis TaxID=1045774 RepID=A0A1G6V2U1_9ACTN|nr:hypothetical protein [Nocardioides lianchengensis]NYG11116.1 hypothetical protein [Nocardioides lianchengensis]SDD47793.1 hypothetical protein SAMN05421872_108169 [Nocardioides lianchengensis]
MTRTAARAAVLALTGVLAATTLTTTALTTTAPPATAGAPAERAEITRVVLRVVGCDDCSFTAHSYRSGEDAAWSGPVRRVRDGKVVLRVPTRLTEGMSISLTAPWERRTGAVSNVVFRYRGQQPGDRVSPQEAREARRGSACFPGIDAPRIKLRVKVHRAHFPGTGARATGAAAYTVVSQPTVGNRERVYDGFLGSQDVIPCR